jgi:hypothetical protein
MALVFPLLAACGGTGGDTQVRSASAAAASPRKPYLASVRKPASQPQASARVLALPGLEGVIGATGADLVRRFGPPRLDVQEGDARKLQFSGTPCVLDVYLYPSSRGADPQATYVDARRPSDGQDVDRAQCVAALGRK